MYLNTEKGVLVNMPNLRMIRVQSKLDELFTNKIDLTDTTNDEERQNKYYTRAIAALAIVMRCGIDYDSAAKTITDGYHDMGIDAVYNDAAQKKLFLVQSKWRKDGNGSISQEEANAFISGIKRVINFDFDGCNAMYPDVKLKENVVPEKIVHHTGQPAVDTEDALRLSTRQYYAAVSGLEEQFGRIITKLTFYTVNFTHTVSLYQQHIIT